MGDAGENVEVLRRAYRAFNRGDFAASVVDFAPEFEWAATGLVPGVKGIYRGPDGYRRFMESWWAEFDEPRIEVHELTGAGDHVLASLTVGGRGRKSGVEANWDLWHVWTVEHGRVIGHQVHTNRDEALLAAGLSA